LDSVASNSALTIEYDLRRAIDIMESLRHAGYPIAELVTRYGSSKSVYVLVSLAFFVAEHAGEGAGSTDISPVFLLAERMSGVHHPKVLTGCLSALHREVSLGEHEKPVLPPPASAFVVRAFGYSGDEDWIVYTAGLNLLQTLCSFDTLRNSFSEDQIESLRAAVARIWDFKNVDLRV
jgi:hypothetical protein